LKIPMGRAVSYSDIACKIENPKASRAVGAAVGKNPVSFVVPCHRALGKDGKLTGYHWGITRKQAMLGWEAGRLGANAAGPMRRWQGGLAKNGRVGKAKRAHQSRQRLADRWWARRKSAFAHPTQQQLRRQIELGRYGRILVQTIDDRHAGAELALQYLLR